MTLTALDDTTSADVRVGVVSALRRFPVKTMQGELLRRTPIGVGGVLGDRALAVVDRTTGEVVGGKTPKLGPLLLACRAAFVDEPQPGAGPPPVAITLPDGTCVRSDARDVDDVLSRYAGHPIGVVASAPLQCALVANRRAFADAVGRPGLFDAQTLLDALPVSVLTTSTLERLGSARSETSFDERRFRMNVVVATEGEGFVENDWPDHPLRLGREVSLRVAVPVPRCAVTTMAQQELPRDPAVLRTVARENSLVVGDRPHPCVGVYATVEVTGEVATGDAVHLG